ncbi:BREX-1 system adenine-specific DNA-methyltransferase PglX [Escherichia coli]|nr:BREX-1 system adenine-specific DNA-methyltransferase PglX [Escherichia coli]
MGRYFFRASAESFSSVPGAPIAYWTTDEFRATYSSNELLGSSVRICAGLQTGDNDRFLRFWHETSLEKQNLANGLKDSGKWFPYNKGGELRKWYGNRDYVVNWELNGKEIYEFRPRSVLRNPDFYFLEGITWSDITTRAFAARYTPPGCLFDVKGSSAFPSVDKLASVLALMNSCLTNKFMHVLNPTVTFQVGDISRIPLMPVASIENEVRLLTEIAKDDWDAFERSWDFTCVPLLRVGYRQLLLKSSYQKIRAHWQDITQEMQRIEEENNRLLIDAYGLQDELTPEVPLSEITLTCNPHYRYGGNLTDDEREARLQSDTICELISYAIGCMMGRYSLDREGLVYAHAGNEGFKALVEEGAYATFAADEDGILPLSAESWFADDVAARFEAFVRTVWGAEQFEENLQFIADSLCLSAIKPVKKGGETSRETLRRYLTTQFYKDHLKTYKKRPIYWLFSSGKEKAFECLVYLHRYNEATLPRMRTEYVAPLLGQIASRIERKRMEQTEASTSDAKRISKEIDSLTKQLAELRAFDDQLKHHADMRISLDLDDGVKVNYGKFGTLLSDVKAISGDKGE